MYRKGSRGLYYNDDGSLRHCEYNEYRLNVLEQYAYVWNNINFFSDFWECVVEVFRYVLSIIFTIALIPFLGFYGYFKSQKGLKELKEQAKNSKWARDRVEKIVEKFSSNYYEYIEE